MGDWTITVSGTGSHHNGTAGDADRLAQHFVDDLVEAQQTIRVAIASFGGVGILDTLTPERERYQAQLEAHYRRDPQRFPYESIAEKLAEFDERALTKMQQLAAVNLLPGNLQKSYWEQQVERGATVQWRYEPGGIRKRSVDGGKTWELAPEPTDVIDTLRSVEDMLAELRFENVGETISRDDLITYVHGNIRDVVGKIVDRLGIREEWENAASVARPNERFSTEHGWPAGTEAQQDRTTATLTSDAADTRTTTMRGGSTEASDQA